MERLSEERMASIQRVINNEPRRSGLSPTAQKVCNWIAGIFFGIVLAEYVLYGFVK